MRTTLNIEEEALLEIKKYAEDRQISLGQATSDLVHRGAQAIAKPRMKNGWVQMVIPRERVQANADIEALEQQDYEDEYRRAISPRR